MAGLLNLEDEDVVERLVDEVALKGNVKGVEVDELRKIVAALHDAESTQKPASEEQTTMAPDEPAKTAPIDFDDEFFEEVLKRLANHPDVEIKTDHQAASARTRSSKEGEALPSDGSPKSSISTYNGKRISTTESRTWHTITGHEKGDKIIPPAELQLLFVIASYGSKGIIQPEATRLTGQDKRSVPLRTNQLANRGYIVKEAVLSNDGRKHQRTSILKLKRFAASDDTAQQHSASVPGSESLIFYDEWYRKTMHLLEDNDGIIAFQDLRVGLEIDHKQPETRAYSTCINRLVETGCLKKLQARIEEDDETHDESRLIPCVQLLREPIESDAKAFGRAGDVTKTVTPKKSRKSNAVKVTEEDSLRPDADAEAPNEEVNHDVVNERVTSAQLVTESISTPDNSPAKKKQTRKKRTAAVADLESEDVPSSKSPRLSSIEKASIAADTTLNAISMTTMDSESDATTASKSRLGAIAPNSTSNSQTHVHINPPGALELKNQNFKRPGRRPKALIVVFKSDSLKGLKWSCSEEPNSSPISTPVQKTKRARSVDALQMENEAEQSRPRKRKKSAKAAEAAKHDDLIFGDDEDRDHDDVVSMLVIESRNPVVETPASQHTSSQAGISPAKKRGRPPKADIAKHESELLPKKRGRPPKAALTEREQVQREEEGAKRSLVVRLPVSPGVLARLPNNGSPMGSAKSDNVRRPSLIAKLPVSPISSYKAMNHGNTPTESPAIANRRMSLIAKFPMPHVSERHHTIRSTAVQKDDVVEAQATADSETSPPSELSLIVKLPGSLPATSEEPISTHLPDDTDVTSQTEDEHDESTPESEEDLDLIDAGALDRPDDSDYHPDVELALEDYNFDLSNESSYAIEDLQILPALIQTDTDLSRATFVDDNSLKDGNPGRGAAVREHRNEIAMAVLKKAGGAFPGKQSFHYPFATVCRNRNMQTPTIQTSARILEGLIIDGRLKRYKFQFKIATGVDHERDIITEADFDPTSDVAKKMQKSIIDSFPRMYLPKGLEVDPSLFRSESDMGRKKLPKNYDTRFGAVQLSKAQASSQIDEFPVLEGATVKRTAQGVAADEAKSLLRAKPFRERGKTSGVKSSQDRIRHMSLALLATPSQGFHAPSGTFSTGGIIGTAPSVGADEAKSSSKAKVFQKRGKASVFKPPTDRMRSSSLALLINPSQSFHEPTGTFATSGITGLSSKISNSTPKFTLMPRGLESILNDAESLCTTSVSSTATRRERFFREVDTVAAWEAQADVNKEPDHGLVYVNHGLNCPHVVFEQEKQFDDLFYADGRLAIQKAEKLRKATMRAKGAQKLQGPESKVRPGIALAPTSTVAQTNPGGPLTLWSSGPATTSQTIANTKLILPKGHAPSLQPNRPQSSANANSGATQTSSVSGKRKRIATFKAQQNLEANNVLAQELDIHEPDVEYSPSQKRARVKKQREANFPEAERLSIAVAVVRALCHGVEAAHFQQWDIVSHALGFKYNAAFLQKRWQFQVRETRSGEFSEKLQQALYEPFLKAYDDGRLPYIDFENLQMTDWPAIVRWVETDVLPSQGGAWSHDLHFTRKDFEHSFEIKMTPDEATRSQLEARTPLISSSLKGGPTTNGQQDSKFETDLELANSWIRALVMTRDKYFDSKKATEKIKLLGAEAIEKANTKLLQSGAIVRAKVGRLRPGRNFHISRQYLYEFKRWPGISDEFRFLREVAAARENVVEYFKENEQMPMSQDFSEATMLVLTNMMSQGLLKIKTILPERNDDMDASFPRLSKWAPGDLDHTEREHDIETSAFHFAVAYSKTPAFTAEHGLNYGVPIPTQPPTFENEVGFRIPLWVDIHGNVLEDVWDMVLRSVLHVLVYGPGITTKGIKAAHHGKLREWEIQLVVEWLEKVCAAVRFGAGIEEDGVWKGGWKASEWWYCVFQPEVASWKAPTDAMSDDDGAVEANTPSLSA